MRYTLIGKVRHSTNPMQQEVALHFRDQLRAARAAALRDAEGFLPIVIVLERLGAYETKKMSNLFEYFGAINAIATRSPMAEEVPSQLPDFHQQFDVKYGVVREARNAALHEGALARHVTGNAIELSLVLEEAIMSEHNKASDFMVRNPVCAYRWQPLSFIRQTMLVNSFSYLPVPSEAHEKSDWRLISDFRLARYLRKNGRVSKACLIQELQQAVNSGELELIPARTCNPQDKIEAALQGSEGLPTLVISPDAKQLLGILTAFDLL
ncbi:MAG TPA: hypothetical protein VJX29_11185 [Candidatus Acidoferrales bacterium]|nr:hypothetical protein [Candidatus Acidoferrales bacterium]